MSATTPAPATPLELQALDTISAAVDRAWRTGHLTAAEMSTRFGAPTKLLSVLLLRMRRQRRERAT